MSASQAETQDQTQYINTQGAYYAPDEDLDLNGSEEDDATDNMFDTQKVEETQDPPVKSWESQFYERQVMGHQAYEAWEKR